MMSKEPVEEEFEGHYQAGVHIAKVHRGQLGKQLVAIAT